MTLIETINLVALLISPLVAVLVTRWLENRRQQRQLKLHLFSEIFGRRNQVATPELVRALNLIDVVFHSDKDVRRLWRELYEMYCNDGLQNQNGFNQRNVKLKELTVAMARKAGMKRISTLDAERIYLPEGLAQQMETANAIQSSIVDLLNRSKLETVSASDPSDQVAEMDGSVIVEPKLPSQKRSIELVETKASSKSES